MMEPIVRIVDDDEIFLYSQMIFLQTLGWNVQTYRSAIEFLENDTLTIPGCLILDVRMPKMNGLELQTQLEEKGFGDFPIIFLSGHGDIDMAVHTLKHGAMDFLEKPADPKRLHEAVTKAVKKSIATQTERQKNRSALKNFNTLTPREKDVIQAAAKGLSNREIAEQLGIAVTTVKMHRANAFEKMQIHSPTEAARVLLSIGQSK